MSMFEIRKANVMYHGDSKVAFVSARIEDQDFDTLLHLGRGQMFRAYSGMGLRYANDNIFLWCD